MPIPGVLEARSSKIGCQSTLSTIAMFAVKTASRPYTAAATTRCSFFGSVGRVAHRRATIALISGARPENICASGRSSQRPACLYPSRQPSSRARVAGDSLCNLVLGEAGERDLADRHVVFDARHGCAAHDHVTLFRQQADEMPVGQRPQQTGVHDRPSCQQDKGVDGRVRSTPSVPRYAKSSPSARSSTIPWRGLSRYAKSWTSTPFRDMNYENSSSLTTRREPVGGGHRPSLCVRR